MDVPWRMIYAEKRASEYVKKLEDLQSKVDKALELLKMDNPNIKVVIRILAGKGSEG